MDHSQIFKIFQNFSIQDTFMKNLTHWDLPGGPVVKTLGSPCKEAQVRSLVGGPRSHMLRGTDQTKPKPPSFNSLLKFVVQWLNIVSIQ